MSFSAVPGSNIRTVIREYTTPDSALRFSNLFSRLLSQPVLAQKWAILYLLYQLSDSNPVDLSQQSAIESPPRATSQGHGTREFSRSLLDSQIPASKSPQQGRQVFDEAFSRSGLPSFLSPQDKTGRQHRDSSDVPSRRRNRHGTNGILEQDDGTTATSPNARRMQLHPSESSLLRDLPFTLQGVSSTNMSFSSMNSLNLPHTLPAPLISLLHCLAEPALLYKGLSRWLESSEGGLVGQSLRAAIGLEMRSYLGLVATLEGQIRRALTMLDETQPRKGLGRAGVTLKRCVIWTREATMGLRLMSLMVEEARSRKGGQLISLIHSFASSHGDPFVGSFAERLLSNVTRPFYDMLRFWIYDGELSDPYLEFFVSEQTENVEVDGAKSGATSVWEDKYKLDDAMVPTIMTQDFANKVFLIGKSLNFIRYGCEDSAWVESYSKNASRELRYGDTASLETSIDEAYKATMARLIHLLNFKFKLQDHLTALKKYLLLGQGDFIAILQESLSSNLDRPANSQSRHTLTAQLEHAIRNSNAQHDSSEVLRRLDARMLEMSHGEIGWDVFTLEYKVDTPIDVIVTSYGSRQYLKVFNFLWRVKRVEYALDSTWRRCMTGARGVLSSVGDKVEKDWKTADCAMAEMIHFICQLQYYILFEVIEASWDQLQKAMSKPECTLDNLIQAHAHYLKAITRKGLLGASTMDFTGQLHELLKIMLAYKDAVDGLYSYSVAEFTRRQEKSACIETRTAQGKWGVTEADDDESVSTRNKRLPRSRDTDSPMPPPLLATGGGSSDEESILAALRQRLTELANDFRARVGGLLGDLAYQPDTDLRFLGVVMNFNDTYKIVRRSRRKAGESDRRKERGKEKEKLSGAENVLGSRRSIERVNDGIK